MENKFKGKAWVGNICQKFEAMCLEVDAIMQQERVRYVENQLQTVGANVRQFCSEFMREMLPSSLVNTMEGAAADLSPVQNTDVKVHGMSNEGIDGEHSGKEPCDVVPLLHSSSDVHIKGIHFDTCSEQSVDIGMCEKSEMSVKENPIKEKQIQPEMSDTVTLGEESSSMALLSSASNDGKRCKPFVETGQESGNPVEVSVYSSSGMTSSSFINLIESCESELPEIDFTPRDALVESCERELPNTDFTLGDADSEESIGKSDDFVAEEASHNDVAKLDLEAIQSLDKVKLDESCLIVDSTELCSASQETRRHKSYKKKIKEVFASKMRFGRRDNGQDTTCCRNLETRSNQQKGNDLTPFVLTQKSESKDHEFDDSDWEII